MDAHKFTAAPLHFRPRLALLAVFAGLAGCKTSPPVIDPNAKPTIAVSSGEIRMPAGVDLDRIYLIDKAEMTKVYIEMVGIGDPSNEKLLFPPAVAQAIGVTPRQMNRRFLDTVGRSRRFETYDSTTSVTAEQTDFVIDGMVTATTQEIVPIEGGTRVSVTRVRLSVQLKNRYTGKLLFPAPVEVVGQTGRSSGDRVVLTAGDRLSDPAVQQRLAVDYERAMQRAFDDAAVRIDSVLRPMGKVLSVDGGNVGLLGGSRNGLQGNDELVIFRATTTRIGKVDVIASTRPIVVVRCDGVGTQTSQCDVTRRNPQYQPQVGDYAVLTDDSVKRVRVE